MKNKAKRRSLAQDAEAIARILAANLTNHVFIRAHRTQMRRLARVIKEVLEDDARRSAA